MNKLKFVLCKFSSVVFDQIAFCSTKSLLIYILCVCVCVCVYFF